MERFGDAAARLCNAAVAMLGWKPAEFWDATPAELALALEPPPFARGPDAAMIDALKQRFPDEGLQDRPTNMKAAAPAMQTTAPA